MTLTTEIRASLKATQTGTNDFGGPRFTPSLEKVLQFGNGTTANNADILFMDERTIAASSSEDLDLAGELTNAFGATITMVEVVAILIVADAGNTNNVVVGDAAAPVPLFGGTNPTIAIKPGGMFLLAAPGAAGQFAVGAGATDDLKIANSSSGSAVTYKIAVLGLSA